MIATVLGRTRIVAKLLDPEGEVDLWSGDTGDFDLQIDQLDLRPIEEHPTPPSSSTSRREEQLSLFPTDDSEASSTQNPGAGGLQGHLHLDSYSVPIEQKGWFARVLSRTAAAGALLFAGESSQARRIVTKRQMGQSFDENMTPAHPIQRRDTGLGSYVGNSNVVHWSGDQWMEIFHGLNADLYASLERDSVSSYVTGLSQQTSRVLADGNEALIFTNDGTVTGFRTVPPPSERM
jgi:hypothetical protein